MSDLSLAKHDALKTLLPETNTVQQVHEKVDLADIATGETSPRSYEFHPIADCWPLMKGKEFDALVASITERGLLRPITLFQGQILDGRNRYLACLKAGVEPRFVTYEGNDPNRHALDLNDERRHQTDGDRMMVISTLRMLQIGHVGAQKSSGVSGDTAENSPVFSRAQAAKLAGVSVSTVARDKRLRAKATPEVVAAVESGKMSMSEALATIARSVPSKSLKAGTSKPDPRRSETGTSCNLGKFGKGMVIATAYGATAHNESSITLECGQNSVCLPLSTFREIHDLARERLLIRNTHL